MIKTPCFSDLLFSFWSPLRAGRHSFPYALNASLGVGFFFFLFFFFFLDRPHALAVNPFKVVGPVLLRKMRSIHFFSGISMLCETVISQGEASTFFWRRELPISSIAKTLDFLNGGVFFFFSPPGMPPRPLVEFPGISVYLILSLLLRFF